MGDIRTIQFESADWRRKNFPEEHRTAALQVLGVCEEAGELAHAVLKMTQGIRGTEAEHRADAADALGDIFIYMCGVADELNIDLEAEIKETWQRVAMRDWTTNPGDGS